MKNVMIVLLLALAIIFSSCAANAGQSDVTITDPKQTTTTEYKKPPQLTTSYNGEQSEEPVYSAPELDAQGNFIIESASHLMWFADHVNTTAETISVSIKAILVLTVGKVSSVLSSVLNPAIFFFSSIVSLSVAIISPFFIGVL